MEFKRTKSIDKEFYRIRVNEGDLTRLAKIMANRTNGDGKQVVIRIETSDGNEVFTSHEPEFFRSDEMPEQIRSVSIKYSHNDESIECRLSFVTGSSGSVKLHLEGDAQEVSGLLADLEKTLKEKRLFGSALLRVADKFWYVMTFSLFVAALILLIFELWLNFWSGLVPDFRGSDTYSTIVEFGWVIILVTIVTGPFWAEATTKKFLTPVEFTGQLSDPDAKNRKRRVWVVTLVLLPLVVGVLGNAAYEIFRLLLPT